MSGKNKIDALTGARFTAIMVIVISHLEFLKQYSFGDVYELLFHNATLGVDFFFMLSGFGMMLSNIKRYPAGNEEMEGVRELFGFAKRHIKKIYPLYVVMLIVGIPYYILTEVLEQGENIIKAVVYAIIQFVSGLTLLQSATGLTIFSRGLNGVCWFLSSLFCIYLVSPIVIRFLRRKIKNCKLAFLGLGVSILCSLVFAIILGGIEEKTFFNDLCYGSPYRRIFYVICGMVIAQLYKFKEQCKGSVLVEYFAIGAAMIWFFLFMLLT